MNIPEFIFWGTPSFAYEILKILIENRLKPSLIICNPDKPVGRKKTITPPPTKELAIQNNIKVWQPEKLDKEGFWKIYQGQKFGILAAYSKIIPLSIIKIFPKGIIVVHPSLLPKYRGPTPIQSAILNGDLKTGTTIFLMDEKVDHGPILAQETIEIDENITFLELQSKLADISAYLLLKTIPLFMEGKISPLEQDESLATYTKKFSVDDGYIKPEDLEESIKEPSPKSWIIYRKIRALNPEPGVWSIIDGIRTKILEAKVVDNKLKITKIQKAGGRPVFIK